MEISFHFGKVK